MSTMTIAPQPTALRVLDAHDRCDRCGAQAYVAVTLRAGELAFCAHHFQAYERALADLAVAVHDERGRLTA